MASTSKNKSVVKSSILKRVGLLYGLFILAGLMIFCALIYFQYFSAQTAYNSKRLRSRIFITDTVQPHRGSILARDGEPLAISLTRYQVEFDFGSEGIDSIKTFNKQSDSLSLLLANYFGDRTAAQYRKMFRDNHAECYRLVNGRDSNYLRSEGIMRFVYRMMGEEYETRRIYDTLRNHTPVAILPRHIDFAEWEILRKYPLLNWNMGMVYNLRADDQRIEPYGSMARRVVGMNSDKGRFGIETIYDDKLKGEKGVSIQQRITRGFYAQVSDSRNRDAKDGVDVVTTIDVQLQEIAERSLREQAIARHAIWGTTIVMEVATGDVLAMANIGRDPLNEESNDYFERRNYALEERVEMGSVMKLATAIVLLDDAEVDPNEPIDVKKGVDRISRVGIVDTHKGHDSLALRQAVAESSNVYFARQVYNHYQNDKNRFSRGLAKLHLDRPVGLKEFEEIDPRFVHDFGDVAGADAALVRMSYGYINENTPIQIATLYNAIANGGRMVAPQLIRELRYAGQPIYRSEPRELVDQICSDRTLDVVYDCFGEVSRSGTTSYIFRDSTYLSVASKTGTAQYAQNGKQYKDGYYVGSVAAFFPLENPRYTIFTIFHTNRNYGKGYFGAAMAGPVVNKLVYYINNRELSREMGESEPREDYKIKGGDQSQIVEVADRLNIRTSSQNGDWGSVRQDSTLSEHITPTEITRGVVPQVVGVGLKDAMFMLENSGFRVEFEGSGRVVWQSPRGGARYGEGSKVKIRLR